MQSTVACQPDSRSLPSSSPAVSSQAFCGTVQQSPQKRIRLHQAADGLAVSTGQQGAETNMAPLVVVNNSNNNGMEVETENNECMALNLDDLQTFVGYSSIY